ncbi:MAG: DUF1631 domain-containing protein [Gammaproteobacteria bacterium]|nr:MAG: DUF1631 domain-containing protein [Gammaproteobacteria bacterium]
MNTISKTRYDNITSIHGAGLSKKSVELIQRCEKITERHIEQVMQLLFDGADDTLFKLAEKAEDTTNQSLYFDSMRIIRIKRKEIESAYTNNIKQSFSEFKKPGRGKSKTRKARNAAYDDLQIVEETDLEESLAVTSLASKINSRYTESISTLNQRLEHLHDGKKIDEEFNPLGARNICSAFLDATKILDTEIEIKLIIYKLFDTQIIRAIGSLLSEVDEFLCSAGILPTIKPVYIKNRQASPRSPESFSPRPQDVPAQTIGVSAASDTGPYTDQNTVFSDAEIYQGITQLLRRQREINGPSNAGTGNATEGPAMNPAASLAENGQNVTLSRQTMARNLVTTLNNIQAVHSGITNGDAIAESAVQVTANILASLASQADSADEHIIDPISKEAIDIVTMLFEFILDDEDLVDSIKALIARLQIPILKVAILDRNFFGNRNHPAKKLLNELAKAGIGLTDKSPGNERIHKKIRDVVNNILTNFTDQEDFFSTILSDFIEFIEQEALQEQLLEHETIDEIELREILALDKKWVTETIEQLISGHDIPEVIKRVLLGPWRDVMLHSYLEEGEQGELWRSHKRFVDILVWSIEPKTETRQKNKLARVLGQLLDTLRKSLLDTGIEELAVEEIVNIFEPHHMASLRGTSYSAPAETRNSNISAEQTNPEAPEDNDEIDTLCDTQGAGSDLDETGDQYTDKLGPHLDSHYIDNITENIVLASWDEETARIDHQEDEYTDAIKSLENGTWMEFRDGDKCQRGKLAWKSELLDEYTFLNWRSRKTIEKTFQGLAADLRRGSARIIDDIPLIDRALNAIFNKLKSTVQ